MKGGKTMTFRLAAFAAALALCTGATAQPVYVQLIAGLGVPGNQPGPTANLGAVGGVAIDGAGNVYLSLSNYGIIEKLDGSGTLSRFAGTGTPGFAGDGGSALAAQFSAPSALALDGAGNLYIADSGNKRVRKVAVSTGIVTTVAGGGNQDESSEGTPATSVSLGQLGGLASDSVGNLYLTSGCRIRKLNAANGLIATVVGTGVCGFGGDKGPALAAQISVSAAIALDSLGNLYLTDANRVRAVDARSGLIGTLAGTGAAAFSGDNGLATAATLSSPSSIAIDAQFNVFVADTANQRVRRIDGQSGIITTVAGNGTVGSGGDNGPAVDAALSTPKAIAIDASGNLDIADTGNGLIRRVSATSGVISTIAGRSGSTAIGDSGPAIAAQFAGLRGITLDSAGNLYLADTGNCRVRRISASTGFVATVAGTACGPFGGDAGPALEATLNAPGDVAVDSHGNLFIADTGNARVRKVDASSGIITTLAGGGSVTAGSDGGAATLARLVSPAGLALDGNGNVFFSDAGDNRVRRVSAAGIIGTVAGTGAADFGGDGGVAIEAQLNSPAGIALDSFGNLYIADNGNYRVRRVDALLGKIKTIAGNGQMSFSGDAGPATGAALGSPRGVAIDNGGNLWIADDAVNRIRVVNLASGTINTIAGTGAQNSSGDGGLAASAEVNHPWGLAAAADQTIYFSENGSSRLRALLPLNAALGCNVSVFPLAITAPPAGGAFTLNLLSTSLACAWSVSDLPNWITAFPASGAGPGSVALTIAPTPGPAREITFQLARASVRVTQTASAAVCTYTVSPAVLAFPAAGGKGSLTMGTQAGCAWEISGAPAWLSFTGQTSGSGPGSVAYTVPVNALMHRRASFTVAGQTVLVDQNGASASITGTFAHFASGAGWQTGLTLVNTGYGQANGYVNFYDESGNPLLASERAGNFGGIAPATLLSVGVPSGSDTNPLQGWAQLLTDGSVNGYEVFRLPTSDGLLEAYASPETRSSSLYMLPFDTTGGHEYGIAITNSSSMEAVVTVGATDALTGVLLVSGRLTLPGLSHSSFVLTTQYPALSGARGVLRFSTLFSGQISVLGLRLNSTQSITSVPVFIAGVSGAFPGFVDAGILPQVASGGGWSTTIALVNTGGTTAGAHLDFYDDQGAPLPLMLTQAFVSRSSTSADANLAPGTMALIQASGDLSTRTGWARLSAQGNVNGYALLAFSDDSGTKEAATPVFIPPASAYLVPFDNSAGYFTGVAVANNSAQASDVLATLRDSTGQIISTETISIPAWGHVSFGIGSRYPVTANASGTLEFSSPVGGQIGVVGIRAGSNRSFTAVPALARQ
jgi:sugar lactone lactonase YvrE